MEERTDDSTLCFYTDADLVSYPEVAAFRAGGIRGTDS